MVPYLDTALALRLATDGDNLGNAWDSFDWARISLLSSTYVCLETGVSLS